MEFVADLRAQTEPLHHARSETFDQRVRMHDQIEQSRSIFAVAQIEGDRRPATVVNVRRFDTLTGGVPRSHDS